MGKDREINCELTNMTMLVDGDQVLVLDRKDPGWRGIVFPGGHVEPNESLTDSAVREFFEETGLTVEDPVLVGIQDWDEGADGRYVTFFYAATKYHGELHASEEGDVRWVPLKDLKNMNLAHGFEKIYRMYEDRSLSEMYHPQDKGWDCIYY